MFLREPLIVTPTIAEPTAAPQLIGPGSLQTGPWTAASAAGPRAGDPATKLDTMVRGRDLRAVVRGGGIGTGDWDAERGGS